MDRDKPDNFSQAVKPHVIELVRLHHPEWESTKVEVATVKVVSALDDFCEELKSLPSDPDQRKLGYKKAIENFEARFPKRADPK